VQVDTLRQNKIRQIRLKRERIKRDSEQSLSTFARHAWKIIEPGRPFDGGWHIDCISEHLQAVTLRQIRNLLINVPPRHMKSSLTAVLWPAWVWGPANMACEDWMFGSYSPKLSSRDAEKCRTILNSSWYKELWSKNFTPDQDRVRLFERQNSLLNPVQNEKMKYQNIHSGTRISTSIGGTGTGEGGDIIVADDLHKVKNVESDVIRMGAVNWWMDEMSTRGNDPNTVCRVAQMQRTHDRDLSGVILHESEIKYDHLCLPFEYEHKIFVDMKPTTIGFKDPRTKEGERLWHRFDGKAGDDLKKLLKPYQQSGQLQQRPSAKEGAIFKRVWFTKRWTEMPVRFDFFIQTWDLTFGTGEETASGKKNVGAYDVGYALGWFKGKYYVVDEIRKRMEPWEQEKYTASFKRKWGKWCRGVLIEDAANGRATGKKIKRKVTGVLLIKPDGSKEDRANANTDPFQAGDVLFPEDTYATWVADAVEEIINFSSRAKYKDRVDALIQGINHLEPKVAKKINIGDINIGSIKKESVWNNAG